MVKIKTLTLGKSKIINNNELVVLARKKNKVYDNECFVEDELINKITIREYGIIKGKSVDLDNAKTSQDKEICIDPYDYNVYIDGKKYLVEDAVANYFKDKFKMELSKKMNGLFKNTTVDIYMEEVNAVIVCPDYISSEDILNLLSIKDLNIYICDIPFTVKKQRSVCLYNISIENETYELIRQKLESRKQSLEKTTEMVNNIKPSYPINSYMSLENKETAKKIYLTIDKEDQRNLQEFLLKTRGDEVILMIYRLNGILKKYRNKILPIDLLLQSYENINKYKKENDKKLSIDMKRSGNFDKLFTYKIKFSDYKLLIKDLNKRYMDLNKWMTEWYSIAKTSNETYMPNKNSSLYKAAEDFAERLSKIWFISEVILFGSVSKGLEKEGSDVDIMYKFGLDFKNVPDSRKMTLENIVDYEVAEAEKKYPELVKKHLAQGKGEAKLYNTLPLQFTRNRHLKLYEDLGFYDNNITLFKTDSFCINGNEASKQINFKDIDYVLLPTAGYYTFIIHKIDEDDRKIVLEFIKFNYFKNDIGIEEYGVEYIAYQYINKKEGSIKYKLIKNYNKENELDDKENWILETHRIINQMQKNGIRSVNPNANYLEYCRKYVVMDQD